MQSCNARIGVKIKYRALISFYFIIQLKIVTHIGNSKMKLKPTLLVLLSLSLVLFASCETDNDFDDDDGVTVEDEYIVSNYSFRSSSCDKFE